MDNALKAATHGDVVLRAVSELDLPLFFEQQSDHDAIWMVAFTMHNLADRDAFLAKWRNILADARITARTILWQGHVAGNIACFTAPYSGNRELGYWLGREFWNQGIATQAVMQFLSLIDERPLYAHVAHDNLASLRVLEKCGFERCGQSKAFSNARGEEIDEVILQLESRAG